MNVVKGNIWQFAYSSVIGIPTNGFVTRAGVGVMGRGLAAQAKQKYSETPANLGFHLRKNGNVVGYILTDPIKLLAIPVKPVEVKIETAEDLLKVMPKIRDKYIKPSGSFRGLVCPGFHCLADPSIIAMSLDQLKIFIDEHDIHSVHIPLLGCGNGGLDAKNDLIPILREAKLPHTITIVIPQ